MANNLEQCLGSLQTAQTVLLICQSPLDGDSLGSALGLALALEKLGKKTSVHCSAGLPKEFRFLPASDRVTAKFEGLTNEFIISLDCSQAEVGGLKYKPQDNKVNIIITPKKGSFLPEHVSFPTATPQYDVVVTLDCADMKMSGRFTELRTQLASTTKVINIDHHPTNDHFGDYNYVRPDATSTAEVVLEIIDALAKKTGRSDLLDADVATCLITGIITDTGSFQNSNTKAISFVAAGRLLELGARQQDVIRHLFKTKELGALHLWGKILSRLREETDIKMVYSWIAAHDFGETGVDQDAVAGIIDKLMTSVPGTRIALLLRDVPDEKAVKGSLRSCQDDVNVAEIAQLFGGGGHVKAAGFKIADANIGGVRENILETIRRHQRALLSGELWKNTPADRPEPYNAQDIPLAEPAVSTPGLVKPTPSPAPTPVAEAKDLAETVRRNSELKDLPPDHPLRILEQQSQATNLKTKKPAAPAVSPAPAPAPNADDTLVDLRPEDFIS